MKTNLLSLLLSLTACTIPSSRTGFQSDLEQIISASKNSFQRIKDSTITLESGEKAFASKVNLEGTSFCWIGNMGASTYYGAAIAHDVNGDSANKLVNQWNEKIERAIPKDFTRMPLKRTNENNVLYEGTYYRNGTTTMKIYSQVGYYSNQYSVLFIVTKD